ncbi:MAG: type II toxin-antitoxin system RelE/ParE family toxin [Gloeotrichia echinulata IR180]
MKDLEREDRYLIGADIKTVEFGWPIGMPTCRPMGGGLFEVRTSLPQGRIARVLFCIYEGRMVLLHGFIKKTQKTPKKELNLALDRKQILESKG